MHHHIQIKRYFYLFFKSVSFCKISVTQQSSNGDYPDKIACQTNHFQTDTQAGMFSYGLVS